MDIKVSEHGQVVVVSIVGEVDASTSEPLQNTFADQLRQGKNCLVADMSQVIYMSSAGFRVLLATMKEARANGGDLRLSSVQGNVHRVFKTSGFEKFMKLYRSMEIAVASFSS